MADQADVMDLLEVIARSACFPGGPNTCVISPRNITVAQGWPQSKDMDAAMKANNSVVSIYSEPSTTSSTPTPINRSYVAVAPVRGTTVVADDAVGSVTFGGEPLSTDVVYLFLGRQSLAYFVKDGDQPADIASAFLAMVQPSYLDSTVAGDVLYMPSAPALGAAVSGVGKLATKIHTTRSQFEIIVWSPTPADRNAIAIAIDVAIKDPVRFPLKDTTSVLLSSQGTNLRDKEEKQGVFRRDLIVNAIYEAIRVDDAREVVATQIVTQGATAP